MMGTIGRIVSILMIQWIVTVLRRELVKGEWHWPTVMHMIFLLQPPHFSKSVCPCTPKQCDPIHRNPHKHEEPSLEL